MEGKDNKKTKDKTEVEAKKFQKKLSQLLTHAKQNGNFLKEPDIINFFKDLNLTQEDFWYIFEYLEKQHVEIEYSDESLFDNGGSEIDFEDEKIQLPEPGSDSSETSLSIYLKDIGKVPCLNEEEVIELAKLMEAGNDAAEKAERLKESLKEISDEEKISVEEQIKNLNECIAKGEEAKNQLIEANLRLVVSIAKHYKGKGLSFSDLIQEGNEELSKNVVKKFDYHKGYKFSTYATYRIRGSMTRAIANQAKTIRVPVDMEKNFVKYTRVYNSFLQEHGREPTVAELAAEMDISEEKVVQIKKFYNIKVESLDTPIDEDEESGNLIDFVEYDNEIDEEGENIDFDYPNMRNPETIVLNEEMAAQKDEILSESLTDIEREVLSLQLGDSEEEDDRPLSIEEIAIKLGTDTERIRQVAENAQRKMFANKDLQQISHEKYGQKPVEWTNCMDMTASMITPGNSVADLGCDHAAILIKLCNDWVEYGGKRGIRSAVVMETSEKALEKTQRNLIACGKTEQIETRLSGHYDGLEKLDAYDANTVLISGMSAKPMTRILMEHEIPGSVSEMVLQTQQSNDIAELRRCIHEKGFLIEVESMIRENGEFYLVMKAVRQENLNTANQGKAGLEAACEFEAADREDYEKEMKDAFGLLLEKKDPTLGLWLKEELADTNIKLKYFKGKAPENQDLKPYYETLCHNKKLIETAINKFDKTNGR